MGDLSPHFSRSEFRCKGTGRPGHPPHDTPVAPELVAGLEEVRRRVGRPVVIVSGFRCPWWNARVGGAKASQHMHGRAADLPYGLLPADVARDIGFHGIGTKGRYAVHVDVRPPPRATWRY